MPVLEQKATPEKKLSPEPVAPVSNEGLPAGRYAGYTVTTISTVQMTSRFNIVTKQLELVPLPVPTPTIAPSPVGDLELDGRGGYELTGTKELGCTGSYRYDGKTDAIEFTTGMMKGLLARMNRGRDGSPEIAVNFAAGEKDGQKQFLTIYFSSGKPDPAAADRAFARQQNPDAPKDTKPAVTNGGHLGTLLISSTRGTNLLDLATGKIESPLPGGMSHRHPQANTPEFALCYDKAQKLLVRVVGPKGEPVTEPLFATEWSISLPDSPRPALSPDGQRIAFYRREFNLFAKPMLNTSGVVVYDRKGKQLAYFSGLCDPAWTPNGRLVAAGAMGMPGGPYLPDSKDGLFITDEMLGNLKAIPGHFEPTTRPDVSPDGSKIAFLESNALWVVNLDGKNRTKIESAPPGSRGYAVAWSPDGTALATCVHGSHLNSGVYITRITDKATIIVRNRDGKPTEPGTRLSWWKGGK